MATKTSTRLEHFTPAQLQALANEYLTIRREVNSLAREGLTKIQLPEVIGREQKLAALRALDAKEDLWIRISYAGNLNVYVRGAPDTEQDEKGIGYLGVLRRPFTSWCVPHGRYFP